MTNFQSPPLTGTPDNIEAAQSGGWDALDRSPWDALDGGQPNDVIDKARAAMFDQLGFKFPRLGNGAIDTSAGIDEEDMRLATVVGPDRAEQIRRIQAKRAMGLSMSDGEEQEFQRHVGEDLPRMWQLQNASLQVGSRSSLEKGADDWVYTPVQKLGTGIANIGIQLGTGVANLVASMQPGYIKEAIRANNGGQLLLPVIDAQAGLEAINAKIYGSDRPIDELYQERLDLEAARMEQADMGGKVMNTTASLGSEIVGMFSGPVGGVFKNLSSVVTRASAKALGSKAVDTGFKAMARKTATEYAASIPTEGAMFGALMALRNSYDPATGEWKDGAEIAKHFAIEAVMFPAFKILSEMGTRAANRQLAPDRLLREKVGEFAKENAGKHTDVHTDSGQAYGYWLEKWTDAGMPGFFPSKSAAWRGWVAKSALEGLGFSALDGAMYETLIDGLLSGDKDATARGVEKIIGNVFAMGLFSAGSVKAAYQQSKETFPAIRAIYSGARNEGLVTEARKAEARTPEAVPEDIAAMGYTLNEKTGEFSHPARRDLSIRLTENGYELSNGLKAKVAEGVDPMEGVRQSRLRDLLEGRVELNGVGEEVRGDGWRAVSTPDGMTLFAPIDGKIYRSVDMGKTWARAVDLPVGRNPIAPEQAQMDLLAPFAIKVLQAEGLSPEVGRTVEAAYKTLMKVGAKGDPAIADALRLLEPGPAGKSAIDEMIGAIGPDQALTEFAAVVAGLKTAAKTVADVQAEFAQRQQGASLSLVKGKAGPVGTGGGDVQAAMGGAPVQRQATEASAPEPTAKPPVEPAQAAPPAEKSKLQIYQGVVNEAKRLGIRSAGNTRLDILKRQIDLARRAEAAGIKPDNPTESYGKDFDWDALEKRLASEPGGPESGAVLLDWFPRAEIREIAKEAGSKTVAALRLGAAEVLAPYPTLIENVSPGAAGKEFGDAGRVVLDRSKEVNSGFSDTTLRVMGMGIRKTKPDGESKATPTEHQLDKPSHLTETWDNGKSGYEVSKSLLYADGIEPIPPDMPKAQRDLLLEMLHLNLVLNQAREAAGQVVQKPDGEFVPVSADPLRPRLQRMWTPEGIELVAGSPGFRRVLAEGTARKAQNEMTFEKALSIWESVGETFREFGKRGGGKKEFVDSSEISREIRVLADHWTFEGTPVRLFETRASKVAPRLADHTSDRVAIIENFGQQIPKEAREKLESEGVRLRPDRLTDMLDRFIAEAPKQDLAEQVAAEYIRALHGLSPRAPDGTISTMAKFNRKVWRRVMKAWAYTKLSGLTTAGAAAVEPLNTLASHVGYRDVVGAMWDVWSAYAKGLPSALTGGRIGKGGQEAYTELRKDAHRAGAGRIDVPVTVDLSRKGEILDGVIDKLGGIASLQKMANINNELIAVRVIDRLRGRWEKDGLSDANRKVFADMFDLPAEVAARFRNRTETSADFEVVKRGVAAVTQGTGKIAERSRAQESPFAKAHFPFRTFIRNYQASNAKFSKLFDDMARAVLSGEGKRAATDARLLGRWMFGKLAVGVPSWALRKGLRIGGAAWLLLDADEWDTFWNNAVEEIGSAILMQEISGPVVGQIGQVVTGETFGKDPLRVLMESSSTVSALSALADGLFQVGPYANMDAGDRIGTWFMNQVPLIAQTGRMFDAASGEATPELRAARDRVYEFRRNTPGLEPPNITAEGTRDFSVFMKDFRKEFIQAGANRKSIAGRGDMLEILRKAAGSPNRREDGPAGKAAVAASLGSMKLLRQMTPENLRDLREKIGTEQFRLLVEHDKAVDKWIRIATH